MSSRNIGDRKSDHIRLALRDFVEGPKFTLLEDVELIHTSLPELSLDSIDIEVDFLGKKVGAPLMITAITGGSSEAERINRLLADIAQKYRLAIGVGSQRALLLNSSTITSYRIVRDIARDVPIIANIGGTQLRNLRKEDIDMLIKSIDADAIAVHLNPAQELFQPEGDRDFTGILDAIARLVDIVDVPVIVKEVGFGISREVALKLFEIGVKIIDVAGAGGTNWITIECTRARERNLKELFDICQSFIEWGLPTAISIVEVASVSDEIFVIASGGIRSGVDIVKALALGANMAGMARPILKAVIEGRGDRFISRIIRELKYTMLLIGAKSVSDIVKKPIVIMGKLAEWICARGIKLRNINTYISCRQSV